MTLQQIRLVVAAAVVLPRWRRRCVLGPFSITLLNDIGIAALVALGLVLLTGIGGMRLVRPGGVRRHRRLRHRLAHDRARLFALARPRVRARAHRPRRRDSAPDAAPRRPLPAAQHHRLGAVDRVPVRQHRCPRPAHRPLEHPAVSIGRLALVEPPAIYYLIWAIVAGRSFCCRHNLLESRAGPGDPRLRGGRYAARERRHQAFRVSSSRSSSPRCSPRWPAGSTRT